MPASDGDPSFGGPYSAHIAYQGYDLGNTTLPDTGSQLIEQKGRIYYPNDANLNPILFNMPVVVILHGKHVICYNSKGSQFARIIRPQARIIRSHAWAPVAHGRESGPLGGPTPGPAANYQPPIAYYQVVAPWRRRPRWEGKRAKLFRASRRRPIPLPRGGHRVQ